MIFSVVVKAVGTESVNITLERLIADLLEIAAISTGIVHFFFLRRGWLNSICKFIIMGNFLLAVTVGAFNRSYSIKRKAVICNRPIRFENNLEIRPVYSNGLSCKL